MYPPLNAATAGNPINIFHRRLAITSSMVCFFIGFMRFKPPLHSWPDAQVEPSCFCPVLGFAKTHQSNHIIPIKGGFFLMVENGSILPFPSHSSFVSFKIFAAPNKPGGVHIVPQACITPSFLDFRERYFLQYRRCTTLSARNAIIFYPGFTFY